MRLKKIISSAFSAPTKFSKEIEWEKMNVVHRSGAGDDGVYFVNIPGYSSLQVLKHSEDPVSESVNSYLFKYLGLNVPVVRWLNTSELDSIKVNPVFRDQVQVSNSKILKAKDNDEDSSDTCESHTKKTLNIDNMSHMFQLEYINGASVRESLKVEDRGLAESILNDLGKLIVADLWVRNYDRFCLFSFRDDLFADFRGEAQDFLWGNLGNFMVSDNKLVVIDTITTLPKDPGQYGEKNNDESSEMPLSYWSSLQSILYSEDGQERLLSAVLVEDTIKDILGVSDKSNALMSIEEAEKHVRQGIDSMIKSIASLDLNAAFSKIDKVIDRHLTPTHKHYKSELYQFLKEGQHRVFVSQEQDMMTSCPTPSQNLDRTIAPSPKPKGTPTSKTKFKNWLAGSLSLEKFELIRAANGYNEESFIGASEIDKLEQLFRAAVDSHSEEAAKEMIEYRKTLLEYLLNS